MPDARAYPERPYLAVSAAIVRDGKILVVRRARAPAHGLYSLPGGVVELGETLKEAVIREVREETAMTIEPVALAGFREAIVCDAVPRYRQVTIPTLGSAKADMTLRKYPASTLMSPSFTRTC